MDIGVLGTGVVGQTISSKLIQLGHHVMMGSREPDNHKAIAWAGQEGSPHASYGTFADAAAFGEILFNCILGAATLEALGQAGAENMKDKILMDISNPIDHSTNPMTLTVCNTDSLGEQIQRAFPKTRVVKTLNTMNCNVMVEPARLAENSDVFVSGNDLRAKTQVTAILRDWFGWKSVIDLGDITTARAVEMFIPLWLNIRHAVPGKRFNIKIVTS